MAFLSFFLRDDSVPLDSERPGEPGRFNDLTFFSPCLCLPEGVRLPLVVAAPLSLETLLPSDLDASWLPDFSSSFLLFSSPCFSLSLFSSSESSSLYVEGQPMHHQDSG